MYGSKLFVFTLAQIVALGILIWVLFHWNGQWDLSRYIGTVLVIVGISFIGLARYQLGRSFSIRAEAHHLVTTGLYSKVRNPIYVFGMVLWVGVILVFHQPRLWAVLVVLVIMQTIRARREAKVLEAAFGDAYREYRRKTWF